MLDVPEGYVALPQELCGELVPAYVRPADVRAVLPVAIQRPAAVAINGDERPMVTEVAPDVCAVYLDGVSAAIHVRAAPLLTLRYLAGHGVPLYDDTGTGMGNVRTRSALFDHARGRR